MTNRNQVDRWLAGHHSVITRRRALQLGLSASAIDRLLARGQWITLHRGVYSPASSAATTHRALLAAVAACGKRAVASHLSAAWLWGMAAEAPATPWVVSPNAGGHRIAGVHVTRSRTLATVCRRDGVPCTDPLRTLVDCAAVVRPALLSDLVDRSLACRAVRLDDVRRATELRSVYFGRKGVAALRTDLRRRGYIGAPQPSVLESRMARLLSRLGLPQAVAEHTQSGPKEYRLDFAYPDRRLAVEVDGYAWHSSPERMANDQRRRNSLIRGGWTVLVYTWRDLEEDPDRVGEEILAAYSAARTQLVRQTAASGWGR